jgi:hypothetical protein
LQGGGSHEPEKAGKQLHQSNSKERQGSENQIAAEIIERGEEILIQVCGAVSLMHV